MNGYFYDYQNGDTSSLIALNGNNTSLWTAPNEPESLPLLQQISRQKARQFSIAHDIIRGDIEIKNFDPLTIFKDCNNYEYVVVSATFDFLRSIANVEIEQILYDSDISRRDYIFSFFGEGENSIKSVGGISGGSGGTGGGGGMTSSQLEMLTNLADWWKLDEENDAIYSEKNVYSLKGVSALGLGDGGGGDGGGGVDMLDSWANYTEAKADFYAPASLLVPFRNDTLSRLASLEAGGGAIDIEIGVTGSGNAVTGVSKSGNTLTFAKSSTFALSTHNHTIAQVTGLQGALNLKAPLASPTFTGNVTAPTFIGALTGNASSATKLQTARTIWGQSFNGEGNVLGALTGATTGSFSSSVSTPKVDFGNGFTIEPSGTELVFKYQNVIKQRMLSDGTILGTGGITALSTE